MSMKNSNETIGNQSRDLPVCSAVPQPLRHHVPHNSCSYGLKIDVALVVHTVTYGLGLLPVVTLPIHGHAWVVLVTMIYAGGEWKQYIFFAAFAGSNICLFIVRFHNTVEPLLSRLMTGCRWPDNQRRPENNLLMPLYMYVKII
jgi:hypothetical protein